MTTPVGGASCWNCGRALQALEYGRQDICPGCRRDTKVCRNCGFYDRAANNECHESQADRVVDKDRSNFCDYFKPVARGSTAQSALSASAAAKAAAEALFRKK